VHAGPESREGIRSLLKRSMANFAAAGQARGRRVADNGGIQAGSGAAVWPSASRLGGAPNMRRYSRLNCEGLA
jgi:hypothetical protein